VLKDRVRRSKLTDVETFTLRVFEGSKDTPVKHLQSFIQHSLNCFPKCVTKEPL
ncbi:uncharacterized protein B0P05DRAFT_470892, partial [Gilbertella persicaria]|uniref:uncharacterized protein n=1 Tax=Gilbertella persicaria TaxID=101096 RepID=UPI00221FE8BE